MLSRMNLNKLEDRIPELLRVICYTMRDKCILLGTDYIVCSLTDTLSITIKKDSHSYYKITLSYETKIIDSCLTRDSLCEELFEKLGPDSQDIDNAITALDKLITEKDPWK